MTEVEIATPMEEVNTNTEVTMDTVLAKIEEMNQLSKWLQKYGKQYIRKNTRNQKRRNLGENGKSKSGFAVPVTVSEQLALFLGMNLTDEIPRTEVTKRLTAYIKENDLQIEGNRKNFTVDQALSQVFNVPQGTTTNWFEMQKFLSGLLVTVKKKNIDDQTTTKVTGVNNANTTNTTTANERNANPPENTPDIATELPKKKKIKKNA
jgi:chromatin remodeling complex protein RSC6